MDDDEINNVPQNAPMSQIPQGVYIRQPEKKKKKLTKKQVSAREKKIKHNLDIRLGVLPPNTPPKKLTEEENIEFQQRLVNIRNINISKSTARAGLSSTTFPNPGMEIPPQYPNQPGNLPIGVSAPVSSGYAIGGSGQIVPIPMSRPQMGLLGESEEILRLMDRTDRQSADKPIDAPQGQLREQPQEGTEGRGLGVKWLKQGGAYPRSIPKEEPKKGRPIFPDEYYIGPNPMKSKHQLDQEANLRDDIRKEERRKRTETTQQPVQELPPSITRFTPAKGGPSQQEGKMVNEIEKLKHELKSGKLSEADAQNKGRRITELEENIKEDREKWRDKRATTAMKKRERSKSVGGEDKVYAAGAFRSQDGGGGVGLSGMMRPPTGLGIDVDETPTTEGGSILEQNPVSFHPPAGFQRNMGGELERIPEAKSPEEKADLAWQQAMEATGLSPKAESPLPDHTPPPTRSPSPERGRGRSLARHVELTEAQKAKAYFSQTRQGENLFTGGQGGVNRDMVYYYQQKRGVPKGEEHEPWEIYKRSGKKIPGHVQGQGHKAYYDNFERFKKARESEPELTHQVWEYRRAIKRDDKRAKKETAVKEFIQGKRDEEPLDLLKKLKEKKKEGTGFLR